MIKGYLDNAATTETKFFAKDYYVMGNPNSPTAIGRQAHEALEEAKQRIKNCLGVKNGEILFCRCATEAVEKLVKYFSGDICCSLYEHDSVTKACEWCSTDVQDYPNYIEKTKFYGQDNFFYLHQYVNQITGTIYDIENIGKVCRKNGAYFGSDFTAAIGHAPIPENLESFCDAVWFSGHKFHAEQGIGAIWISENLLKNRNGMIPYFEGTPNVSGAVAMSYAMKYATNYYKNNYLHYLDSYYDFIVRLEDNNIKFTDVGDRGNKRLTVAICAITLPGFNADALVQFLSSRGIYISAGHSACSGNQDFHTLEAFGLSQEEAEQTIRVSFCEDTTVEDIDNLVNGIVEFKEKFM